MALYKNILCFEDTSSSCRVVNLKLSDIRMCSRGLFAWIAPAKLSCQHADMLQLDGQNFLSTILLQVVQQVATSLQITRCNKTDFIRLAAT